MAPKSNKGKILPGTRGVSWREKETLDLLILWGERKVQEALSSKHTNIDIFGKIAADMARRGHQRSAEECRTKSKTLRQEYRKVMIHNNQSGNAPKTCPFYNQLHDIFGTDPSTIPPRLSQSLDLRVQVQHGTKELQEDEYSEELFTEDLQTINSADFLSSTYNDSGKTALLRL